MLRAGLRRPYTDIKFLKGCLDGWKPPARAHLESMGHPAAALLLLLILTAGDGVSRPYLDPPRQPLSPVERDRLELQRDLLDGAGRLLERRRALGILDPFDERERLMLGAERDRLERALRGRR
jgi:hypothetical protein